MSAIGNIAINDGQATPVLHTFVPYQTTPLPAWNDTVTGLSTVLQSTIKVLAAKCDTKSGLFKVTLEIALPVGEVVTGQNAAGYTAAPKVAFVAKCVQTWFLPLRSTEQQRKDLRVLTNGLLSAGQVTALLEKLEIPY